MIFPPNFLVLGIALLQLDQFGLRFGTQFLVRIDVLVQALQLAIASRSSASSSRNRFHPMMSMPN